MVRRGCLIVGLIVAVVRVAAHAESMGGDRPAPSSPAASSSPGASPANGEKPAERGDDARKSDQREKPEDAESPEPPRPGSDELMPTKGEKAALEAQETKVHALHDQLAKGGLNTVQRSRLQREYARAARDLARLRRREKLDEPAPSAAPSPAQPRAPAPAASARQ